MSPRAERQYARLLGLYPKVYREERGDEMLATLAEADRPIGHETAVLIMGAVRARGDLARFTSLCAGADPARLLRPSWANGRTGNLHT